MSRKKVREHIKHRVDWIKLAATGGFGTYGSLPGAASYSVEEMRAAVEEAAKVGRHVMAHAHGAEGIRNAIEAGVRSIEHGTLMDEATIQAFLEADIFLVPDLLAARYDLIETDKDWSDKELEHPNAEEYRQYAKRVARAHRAGVRIAFGTDAGIYPHGRNAEQLGLLVNDVGMTSLEAIRSATLVAAELLGIEGSVGREEEGYRADLIAVDGDPLADVSTFEQVRFVMKEGRVIVPGAGCGSVSGESEDLTHSSAPR